MQLRKTWKMLRGEKTNTFFVTRIKVTFGFHFSFFSVLNFWLLIFQKSIVIVQFICIPLSLLTTKTPKTNKQKPSISLLSTQKSLLSDQAEPDPARPWSWPSQPSGLEVIHLHWWGISQAKACCDSHLNGLLDHKPPSVIFKDPRV